MSIASKAIAEHGELVRYLSGKVCRVERLLTILIANPDQDHTDELADVKQFRVPHPAAALTNLVVLKLLYLISSYVVIA